MTNHSDREGVLGNAGAVVPPMGECGLYGPVSLGKLELVGNVDPALDVCYLATPSGPLQRPSYTHSVRFEGTSSRHSV